VDFGFENRQEGEDGEFEGTELWKYSLQNSECCRVKSKDYELIKDSAFKIDKIEFTDKLLEVDMYCWQQEGLVWARKNGEQIGEKLHNELFKKGKMFVNVDLKEQN
jgi:hypothetical protein